MVLQGQLAPQELALPVVVLAELAVVVMAGHLTSESMAGGRSAGHIARHAGQYPAAEHIVTVNIAAIIAEAVALAEVQVAVQAG